jgi:hypothetical protein
MPRMIDWWRVAKVVAVVAGVGVVGLIAFYGAFLILVIRASS